MRKRIMCEGWWGHLGCYAQDYSALPICLDSDHVGVGMCSGDLILEAGNPVQSRFHIRSKEEGRNT